MATDFTKYVKCVSTCMTLSWSPSPHRVSYSYTWHLFLLSLSSWTRELLTLPLSDGPIHFLSGKSPPSHAQTHETLTIVERSPKDTPPHFSGASALLEFRLPHYIFVDMGSHLGSSYSGKYSSWEVLIKNLLWWDSPQKINFNTLKAPFNNNNAKPISSQI